MVGVGKEQEEEEEQPAAIVRISPSMRPLLCRLSSSPSQGDTTWGLRRRLLDETRRQVAPASCSTSAPSR